MKTEALHSPNAVGLIGISVFKLFPSAEVNVALEGLFEFGISHGQPGEDHIEVRQFELHGDPCALGSAGYISGLQNRQQSEPSSSVEERAASKQAVMPSSERVSFDAQERESDP